MAKIFTPNTRRRLGVQLLNDEEVYAMLPPSIAARIEFPEGEGCWIWTGATSQSLGAKYGNAWINGAHMRAHRYTCGLARGRISADLVVDHLCRTPLCVRPSHLEPVSHRANVLRGIAPNARATRTNRCGRGHVYTPENTYFKSNGARECRACKNFRDRRARAAATKLRLAARDVEL